jgi:hypothetical protein
MSDMMPTYDEQYLLDADDAVLAELEEQEDQVREQAKQMLLAWYHAKNCTPSQGCSCDLAREEYAGMPTVGLTFAAAYVRGCI